MSAAEDLETMRSILLPFVEGDARPFLRSLADDIVWHVAGTFPWAGSYRGKQALHEQLLGVVAAKLKQPYRMVIKHLRADGEFVTVVLHGVDNETLEGVPYPQQYCWICRLQEGKLKEITEFADSYLAMRTLGPPPVRVEAMQPA